MGSDARAEMLERIRKAVKRSGAAAEMGAAAAEYGAITREYRRGATHDRAEILHMLVERLKDYDADVVEVSRGEVAGAVAKFLEKRGRPKMVMPEGFTAAFLPEGFGFEVDRGMTTLEVDGYAGVITEATLAIAETGSFVLQGVPGQGRRVATLVPDYHLCIIDAATVVESVPEAMAKLQATATLPTTFVSGPSATADIEMTRVKGVHGPRFLDVVVYGGGEGRYFDSAALSE